MDPTPCQVQSVQSLNFLPHYFVDIFDTKLIFLPVATIFVFENVGSGSLDPWIRYCSDMFILNPVMDPIFSVWELTDPTAGPLTPSADFLKFCM